jgi:hypothetical protein
MVTAGREKRSQAKEPEAVSAILSCPILGAGNPDLTPASAGARPLAFREWFLSRLASG